MVEIRILENIEISNLSDLISNYAFKPYSNYFKLSPEMSTNYFSYEIQNTVDTKENYIIGLIEKKTYRAFCVLKKLELDSELLQKNCYSLHHLVAEGSYASSLKYKTKLLQFLNLNFKNKIDMLSSRINAGDISTIHALEKQSFHFMDSLVTYSFEMPHRADKATNPFCSIRLSEARDLIKLKEIAKNSFFIDRYHNDPKIPTEQSNRIYERFIENATKGIGADKVFVAEYNNDVIGFNTIELQNRLLAQNGLRIGSFVLNAVSSNYRNRGVYSSLINDSLIYLNDYSDFVEVRTHSNNYPVHRALSRLGFTLTMSQLTFHQWNPCDNNTNQKRRVT